MKKWMAIFTAVFIAMTLTGMEKSKLKDGTYESSAQGMNGPIFVETTFKDGKIAEVKVVEHSETPNIGDTAFSTLIPQIVGENSVTPDTVAGATVSSKGLLEAVKKAIKEAGGNVKHFQKKKK